MHAKLTLRLDEELIRVAKSYSEKRGKSLSKMVADYFALLTAPGIDKADEDRFTPLVRSLKGSLRGAELDEADYRRHLEEKHR